jgi:hypothetical protein
VPTSTIVVGCWLYNGVSKFATQLLGCANTTVSTFTGWTTFAYQITAQNLINAVNAAVPTAAAASPPVDLTQAVFQNPDNWAIYTWHNNTETLNLAPSGLTVMGWSMRNLIIESV